MNIYAFGYWYTCDPLLAPVVRRAEYCGHTVQYENTWTGREARPDFPRWLAKEEPGRVFLLTCDINTGAHAYGVDRVKQCKERGIPTVSIQHGVPPHKVEATADHVCVWGHRFSPMFTGAQPHVTGNPALENPPNQEYAQGRLVERAAIRAPYALFTASMRNRYSAPPLLRQAIRDVAKILPVVISPHPNPAESSYLNVLRDMANDAGHTMVLEHGHDMLRLLVSAANLVFGRSSVLIEAAAQGIPALVVRDMPDVYADGKILHQYDGPESVARALRSQPNPEFTFRHCYHLGGTADRIVGVLQMATERLPSEALKDAAL